MEGPLSGGALFSHLRPCALHIAYELTTVSGDAISARYRSNSSSDNGSFART
ncbi:hypothetical protein JOD27_005958 [Lentzea nigeriaca]|nr:hypothetical protein [Lentzea nigeriaca]